MNKLIYKQIKIFLFTYPCIYIYAKFIGQKGLYIIKDIAIYVIILQLLILFIREKRVKINKIFLFMMFMALYIFLDSLYQMNDFQFWLYGIREMIINPTCFILMGYFITYYYKDEYHDLIWRSLFIAVFFSFVYMLISPNTSFGSTNRLSSFWDSAHEPAIIGGLLIVITYYKTNIGCLLKMIAYLGGVILMILSASRSIFLAVFFALFLSKTNISKINFKNCFFICCLLVSGVITTLFFSEITNRDLMYNLQPRINQYSFASTMLKNNFLFGIGIDKYGAVGNNIKMLSDGFYYTTTMDSTLIKYVTNLGIIFLLQMIWCFILLLKCIKKDNTYYVVNFTVLIFGLIMGMFTGKMGAFPLNMYFYGIIGAVIGLTRHYSFPLIHK